MSDTTTVTYNVAYGYFLGRAEHGDPISIADTVTLAEDFARMYVASDGDGTPADLGDGLAVYRINLRSAGQPSTTRLRDERIYS